MFGRIRDAVRTQTAYDLITSTAVTDPVLPLSN